MTTATTTTAPTNSNTSLTAPADPSVKTQSWQEWGAEWAQGSWEYAKENPIKTTIGTLALVTAPLWVPPAATYWGLFWAGLGGGGAAAAPGMAVAIVAGAGVFSLNLNTPAKANAIKSLAQEWNQFSSIQLFRILHEVFPKTPYRQGKHDFLNHVYRDFGPTVYQIVDASLKHMRVPADLYEGMLEALVGQLWLARRSA